MVAIHIFAQPHLFHPVQRSLQHLSSSFDMQLVTLIGAVALLSTSAMAVPDKIEEKSPVSASHSHGRSS